jgi:hypothetical protein
MGLLPWTPTPMTFKYYDVETGTEKEVDHGASCPCGTCSKARLRSVIDDVIKAKGAHAPHVKKSSGRYKHKSHFETPKHDWFGKPLRSGPDFDLNEDEGKCFGWNPESDQQVYYVTDTDEGWKGVDVYMMLSDKPMSPDMTKGDMAIMSVDQQKACLTLKVLYNPFFNERMKKAIESKYRNWNSANKCWEFHPSKMKDIQAICGEFYKGVQIIGQKPVLGTKFEKLLTKLTKDDKQSIYRLMALKYHPDKGGDHETMSLLNEVFKNG